MSTGGLGGGIRVGRGFFELYIDSSRMSRGLSDAQRRLYATGQAISDFGRRLFIAGLVGAGAFLPAIKEAASLEATLVKFNAVFSDQAVAMRKWGQALATALQRPERVILDMLATFRSITVGFGFDPTAAANFSKELTKLAFDFAVFNKLSDGEAQQRFVSALEGEAEALDRYGVNLKEQRLNAELQNLGFAKTVRTATEQQKVLARISIIKRTFGQQGAIGAVERETSTLIGQFRRLKTELINLGVAVGTPLIAKLRPITEVIQKIIKQFTEWVKANEDVIIRVAKLLANQLAVAAAFISFGFAIKLVASSLGAYIAVLGIFKTIVFTIGAVIAFAFSPLPLLFLGLAYAFVRFREQGGKLFEDFKSGLDGFGEAARGAVVTVREAFQYMLADFTLTWGAIINSIQAGNVQLAFKIAMTQLKVTFTEATGVMKKYWLVLTDYWGETAINGVATVLLEFNKLRAEFRKILITMGDTWRVFVATLNSERSFDALFKQMELFQAAWLRTFSFGAGAQKAFEDAVEGIRKKYQDLEVGRILAEDKEFDQTARLLEIEDQRFKTEQKILELKKQALELLAKQQAGADEQRKNIDEQVAGLRRQLDELRKQASLEAYIAAEQAEWLKRLRALQEGLAGAADGVGAAGGGGAGGALGSFLGGAAAAQLFGVGGKGGGETKLEKRAADAIREHKLANRELVKHTNAFKKLEKQIRIEFAP